MKTKHLVLDELYQIQLINKKDDVVLKEISLPIDVLKDRIRADEKTFFAILESLQNSGDIFVDWKENSAFITKNGIVNFADEKYLKEHRGSIREKWLFIIKVIGLFSTIIAILIGLNKLFEIIKINNIIQP